MIFIGTINLTRTRERGDFYCPDCESVQSYRLRAKRPWLTLYFIPVVPIGSVELVIQCDDCRSNWDTSVLEVDKESHQQLLDEQVQHEIFRSMILFVLTDGYMNAEEIAPLGNLASKIFSRPIDREELGRLCSRAEQSGVRAGHYVESVFKHWNGDQQRLAIQVMFLAASLRGELGSDRTEVLMGMRERAGLSESEFEALIAACLERPGF